MTKGQEALNEIKISLCEYEHTLLVDKQNVAIIETELKKTQRLYNLIKQKRDNARLAKEAYAIKQDVSAVEKIEICTQIDAYNDILLLVKSMFEVKENE